MPAFLCSYLDCKCLLINNGCLQQPSASWGLSQEESDVHGRNFFLFNTGLCLDLFFICFLSTPHCPLQAARAAWPAFTGCPPPQGHTGLGIVTLWRPWLLMPLEQMVSHHPSSPQGGESHSHPGSQGGQHHPDQDQAGPTGPRPCAPLSSVGSGALSMKDRFIFLFISSSRLKAQMEDCQCMAVPQIKTINSLVFLFVPLLSQSWISDEREVPCLLHWTPLVVSFPMITAIWDPGTSP